MPKPLGSGHGGMAIGIYIFVHLLWIDLAILEFAVILAMKSHKCFRPKTTDPQAMDVPDHEHIYCQIDRVAFYVYMVFFIVFNVFFWSFYH